MRPNAALALTLMGIAGALCHREGIACTHRILITLLTLTVLVGSVITLAEYALRVDLHIDQVLLRLFDSVEPGPYPGRPSPPTALALTLLSAGLLLIDFRPTSRVRPSEWLLLGAFFTAFVALVGFAFGAGPLYRLMNSPVTGVAVPSAVSLILISVGVLLARPNAGVMRIVTSAGPGGIMLRRLAIPALVAPVLLGPIVVAVLAVLGVEDFPLVAATLAIALTAVALLLLVVTALPLDRAYGALQASRSRIRDLVQYAPDGIFVANLAGRFIDVNDAGCRMLGFSREEIVGKWIVEILPPAEASRLEVEKARMLKGENVVSEWPLRRKDGTYLPVEVSAKIIADGRWQGFVRDISERKRIEREERILSEVASVLASTLDYETTLESLARLVAKELADICVVVTVEADGSGGQLKVVHRDPAIAGTANVLQRVSPTGWNALSGLSGLDHAQVPSISDVNADDLEQLAVDDNYRRALREIAPVSLLGVPLLAHGRLVGKMVLIRTSVTPRFGLNDLRFAEEIAYRAAWAVENARLYRTAVCATQARDDLIGVVAHDLRNPLSAIIVQASILQRHAGQSAEPQSQESVEMINRAATRMSRLIDDLLDITRIEAGGLSIDQARVPVHPLISDCLNSQYPLAAASSIELTEQVEEGVSEVWGDRDRLMQILENLISNSIKYSERGARITVGAAQGSGEVRFFVADQGSGIPVEYLPYVFDRFWQARNTGRRGAGLGLAIVKGLVEAQGGRVWVESTPGIGSTFYFTIPSHPAGL